MKIELKHLAPYLPYGLKFALTMTDDQFTCVGLTVEVDGIMAHYNGGSANVSLFKYYKPVLRPMSDLGKLNVIEGNHITPIVEIFNVRFASGAYDIIEVITDNDKCTLKVAWDKAISSISSFSFVANDNSFVLHDGSKQQRVGHQLEMFQKLFEHHFDVFGLIPAGLAIDINTLDKEL